MHWIIQKNLINPDEVDRITDAVSRIGKPYTHVKVIPFVGQIEDEDQINPKGNVICMGAYSMRLLAKKKGWVPGVFDLEPVNFLVQRMHWGEEMLNYDSIYGRLRDFKYPRWDEFFVRPIDDTKSFAGTVMTSKEFFEWQHKVVDLKEEDGSTVTGETMIMMSEPKNIAKEFRFWIVDGKIATSSIYKIGSRVKYEPVIDRGPEYYASRITDAYPPAWQPARAYVLDIAELPDNTYKILEINTINSAGYYAADLQKLVVALEGMRFDSI